MEQNILLTTKPRFLRDNAFPLLVLLLMTIAVIIGMVSDNDTWIMIALFGSLALFAISLRFLGKLWDCYATILTVTVDRTILRKGIFSKSTIEVRHVDVLATSIKQTITNRIFGVGSSAIASAGTGGVEIVVSGISNPQHVSKLIDEHR